MFCNGFVPSWIQSQISGCVEMLLLISPTVCHRTDTTEQELEMQQVLRDFHCNTTAISEM